jgi:hypothetical protein
VKILPHISCRIDDERYKLLEKLEGASLREKIESLIDSYFMPKPSIETKSDVEVVIRDHTKSEQIQCEYGSLTQKGLVYCDNPLKTNLPRNRMLPIEACQKCYQRQKQQLHEQHSLKEKFTLYICPFQAALEFASFDILQKHGWYVEVIHTKFGYQGFTDKIEDFLCIRYPDLDCIMIFEREPNMINVAPDLYEEAKNCPLRLKENRLLFVKR